MLRQVLDRAQATVTIEQFRWVSEGNAAKLVGDTIHCGVELLFNGLYNLDRKLCNSRPNLYISRQTAG
jgi:hypothetical protein